MCERITYEGCKPFLPTFTEARCVRVHDGDTIHIGTIMPPPHDATRFCCRILGIDTPELRSRNAEERELARHARDVLRSMIHLKMIGVSASAFDKYGRLLVRITTPSGDDVASTLVKMHLAVPYDGGKRDHTLWIGLLAKYNDNPYVPSTSHLASAPPESRGESLVETEICRHPAKFSWNL